MNFIKHHLLSGLSPDQTTNFKTAIQNFHEWAIRTEVYPFFIRFSQQFRIGCWTLWATYLKISTYFRYRSRALKSRGSYGNSALFFQRSQYISLDFYVLKKTENAKCGCSPRAALKCAATVFNLITNLHFSTLHNSKNLNLSIFEIRFLWKYMMISYLI